MTKVNRRILLTIVTFLAVLCFGLALSMGFVPDAKADSAIAIKSITQTYAQPYNGSSGLGSKYDYSSLYTIDFDQEITELSSYSAGADVTDVFVNFKTNTTFGVNGKSLSDMSHLSAKLYKVDADTVELYVYRCVFWTQIKFGSGITVGNKTLTPSDWYEESDWTFTNTAPTQLKIMAVYEKNLFGEESANCVNLRFAYNMKGYIADGSALKGIIINDENVYTSDTVSAATVNTNIIVAGSSGAYYANDWDSPGYQDASIRIPKSALEKGATITFPKGFTIGSNSLAEAQTFSVGVSNRSDMTNQPVWKEVIEGEEQPGDGGDTSITESIAVSSITQTYAQPYNGTSELGSKYKYSSLYTIDFDKEISELNNYSAGAEVTDLFKNFKTNTTYGVNNDTLNYLDGKDMQSKLYKVDADTVELYIYRPVFWTQIKFGSGITVGDKALTPSDWYEESDWTFTNTAPTQLKIMAVYEKNLTSDASANYVNLRFAYNMKGSIADGSALKGIIINNENVYTSDTVSAATVNTKVIVAGSSGAYYGNDWDSPGGQDAFIRIPNSVVEKGATITFPKGFTIGENSLAEAQTFTVGIDSSYVNTDPADQRVWVETGNAIKSKGMQITSQVGASTSTFSLEFDSTEDVLADIAANADAKAYLNVYSNVLFKIKLNGTKLFDLTDVSIKKTAKNVLEISFADTIMFANFEVLAGLRIKGKMTTDDVTYSLSSIEADTNVTVLDITAETNFGMMGDDTLVRFSLRFADLGMFKDMDLGSDVTSYLNHSAFMDNVLINGVSLTQMKADGRTVNVYRGNKDKEIYQGVANGIGKPYGTALEGKYNVENALEVIIGSLQLYDYTVTVKEGCILGNLLVNETCIYQKQLDESFELLASTATDVMPITIREIPYGSQANTRAILFIFNNPVSFTSDANFINQVKFNGQTITSAEDSFITIKGGCYVNGEVRYGKRQYTVLLDASEYTAFMLGDNPVIEIPAVELSDGTYTKAVKFVLEKGTWVPEGTDLTDYDAPAFVEVLQHGNQGIDSYNPNNNSVNSKYDIDDYKLVRFITNYGYNHYIASSSIYNNLYVNGYKAIEYPYHNSGVEGETKWEGICYSFWLANEIRNYDTGIDVFYIPRGTIISGNRIIDQDTYIYSVRSNTIRDGASNWAWEFFFEKPALEVYKGGQVVVGDDTITATVEFDRVTGKNDVKFGVYNDVSAAATLKINGKLLSTYSGENAFAWTDNGFTVTLMKSELGNYEEDGLNFTFLEDFVTPLGYAFESETSYSYSFENKIWCDNFELANVSLPNNSPVSISNLTMIRVGDKDVEGSTVPKFGYKFSVEFTNPIAGVITMDGQGMPAHTLFRNVTAPYSDLVKLTELGYAGNIIGAGYEYLDYVIDKFISYGIRDSILDNIVINGETVREILARETAYDSLINYPLQITLNGNKLEIIIQEDSVLYSAIKDGFTFSINKNVVFEADCRTLANTGYKLVDNDGVLAFEEYVYANGITVTNTKSTYYQGEDLDLSKIIAYYRNSNDARGDRITVTMDMISGYDKNVIGEQTVTVTVDGLSDTFKVNVFESFQHQEIEHEETESGCGGSFGGNVIVLVAALALCATLIISKKLRKN